MPAGVLHIVDGESTGGTLRVARLGKQAEILVWREALYTGPVPRDLSLKQLSRMRSRFWTQGKSPYMPSATALARAADWTEGLSETGWKNSPWELRASLPKPQSKPGWV